MEFQQVESLRRETLAQTRAADDALATQAPAEYEWHQKLLWCLVQVLRHAWLNIYPLLALLVGVVFVFYVKQTREILAGLERDLIFLGVAAVWAASIWYTMRVLSSTDFPGDFDPHPASQGCIGWLNGESPRVAPFAGLAVIACTSSIFLGNDPNPAWIAPLAAGIVPVTWAAAWLGDRVAGIFRPVEPRPVYRLSVLLIALGAAAIASYSWSTVPQPARAPEQSLHTEDWLLALCVALTLAPLVLGRRSAAAQWAMAAAFGLWVWIVFSTAGHHPWAKLPFLVLALAAFGFWLVDRRRELFGIGQDAATPHFEVGALTFGALGAALALQIVLVFLLTKWPIVIGMRLGTLALVFLALSLLACFGIVWVFLPKYATWPSLAAVPLLWAVFLGNAPDYTLQQTKFAQKPPQRPELAEHFKLWLKQLPEGEASPIFFVAAAGGGLRAAYWTASMLAAADDRTCGEFGRHVYAYSGVSGGSLGIAAYLAQRQVWQAKKEPGARCQTGRREEMRSMLRRDFLAPVAGSLLFAEMTQRFFPIDYLDEDRGTTLARAWSMAWDEVFPGAKGKFDEPFLEAFKAGSNPAVFLNATAVSSGQRVLASNVTRTQIPAFDLFRRSRAVGALNTSGLTVREAVLNSARFTYVSPAATVLGCGQPAEDGTCPEYTKVWDRLVDGGYFENSGLATLSDAIRTLKTDALKRRMIVVVIENSNETQAACRKRGEPGADAGEEARGDVAPVAGFTAPLEALLHVREARGQLELRRVRAEFKCEDGQLLDWHLFGSPAERAQARAAGQEPALGWFLSERSAKWIRTRADDAAKSFPFRHAACQDKPLEKGHTVVGDRSQANVACGP